MVSWKAEICNRRRSVPMIYSVQDLTSWTQQSMLHVLPYLVQWRLKGRKCYTMSSKPSVAISATMVLSHSCTSWYARYVLNYPPTRSSAPRGSLSNGPHDTLQGGGVMWYEISSDNVPAAPSCNHIESDDIWSIQMKRLHRKMPQLSVKERDVPAVASQRVRFHHSMPYQ